MKEELKKWVVEWSANISDHMEVEAKNEKEAREIAEEDIQSEIGGYDYNDFEIDFIKPAREKGDKK